MKPPFSKRFFLVILASWMHLTHHELAFGVEQNVIIADGNSWSQKELGVALFPPVGWELRADYQGKTLVMQEPSKKTKIRDYSRPTYQKNVTLAVQHQAVPIDESEALRLREKIEKDFGLTPGVIDFQVLEHRFIDYRSKADAILLYTSFQYQGFAMSQMHILISGSKNSALLTYTDLADSFQNDEASMSLAWNAMLSTQLEGSAPTRYQELLLPAVGTLCLVILAGVLIIWRRRSASQSYERAESMLYRDDAQDDESEVSEVASRSLAQSSVAETSDVVSHVWNLAKSKSSAGPEPVSRWSSSVS